MRNNIELKSIKEANLAQRIIAVIIDGALFIFLFVFLTTIVFTPIANKAFNYERKQTSEVQYATSSHLYVIEEKNDDGDLVIIDPTEIKTSTYQIYSLSEYKNQPDDFYIERVKYYYLKYKTGDVVVPEGKDINDFRAPDFEDKITQENGDKIERIEYYTESWFEQFKANKKVSDLVTEAIKDFNTSSYIEELEKSIKLTQIFVILPSFTISYFVIFFTFPMIFRNGETIGKKMFKIGFVTKDGYNVKRRQIVYRQLLLFIYVALFSFAIGFEIWTTLATLGLGVAIYFISTLFSKNRRSFIDMLSYTYLINTNTSVWFESIEEEKEKTDIIIENTKRIKKPVENKNIIQVKSRIITENLPENRDKHTKSSK